MMLLQTDEHQRLPANPQKLGERHWTDFSSQPSEGNYPVDNLILNFWPVELVDNQCLLFKAPSLGYFVKAALAD